MNQNDFENGYIQGWEDAMEEVRQNPTKYLPTKSDKIRKYKINKVTDTLSFIELDENTKETSYIYFDKIKKNDEFIFLYNNG